MPYIPDWVTGLKIWLIKLSEKCNYSRQPYRLWSNLTFILHMRKLEVRNQVIYIVAKQNLYRLKAPSNTHTHIPTSILSSEVVFFFPMPCGQWDLYLDQRLNLFPAVKALSSKHWTTSEFPPKFIFKRSAVKHYLLTTLKKWLAGTSLVVQWLRLCTPSLGGLGSMPG